MLNFMKFIPCKKRGIEMGIKIKANKNGFHLLSGDSDLMTPNPSLSDLNNINGRVFLSNADKTWQTQPVGDAGLILKLDTSHSLGVAQFGASETITFQSATLYRLEGSKQIEIGTITFEHGLYVDVKYDTMSGQNFWYGDIADSVLNTIKNDGLSFVGNNDIDIFELKNQPIYFTQTTEIRLRGGDDFATGTKGNDYIHGGSGNDTIRDDYGTNHLHGGNGDDHLTLGNDSIISIAKGGRGNDIIISNNGSDHLIGGAGDDHLTGNDGNDILKGGKGNDTLLGRAGKDTIKGGAGDDMILGGMGNDHLTGGSGADTFVFYQNSDGSNIIRDFETGVDHIYLPDFIGTFDDIHLSQKGNNTIITIASEPLEITLRQTQTSDLTADDFIFA